MGKDCHYPFPYTCLLSTLQTAYQVIYSGIGRIQLKLYRKFLRLWATVGNNKILKRRVARPLPQVRSKYPAMQFLTTIIIPIES